MPRSASGRTRTGDGRTIKSPNKALTTVSMIIGVYLISISLTIILVIVRVRVPDVPNRLQLTSVCLWLVNTATNPIIYVYNNRMFRNHIKKLIARRRGEPYPTSSSVGWSVREARARRTTQQSMVGGFGGVERSATMNSLVLNTPVAKRVSRGMGHVIEEEESHSGRSERYREKNGGVSEDSSRMSEGKSVVISNRGAAETDL
eukprot:sb/3470589/